MLFKSCMMYRKKVLAKRKDDGVDCDGFFAMEHLSEAVNETLCPKLEGCKYHKRSKNYKGQAQQSASGRGERLPTRL